MDDEKQHKLICASCGLPITSEPVMAGGKAYCSDSCARENGRRLRKCANCGIGISWTPVIVEGKVYCCQGCAQGGPCICSYADEPSHGAATPDKPPPPEPEAQARPAATGGDPTDEIKASLTELVVSCLQSMNAWQHKKEGEAGVATMRSALEEAAAIFRQAAAKLGGAEAQKAVPSEQKPALTPITIVVSPLSHRALVQQYGVLVKELSGVSQCSCQQWDGNTAIFEVSAESPAELMRALWKVKDFRPRGVKLSGDRVEVSLGDISATPEPPVAEGGPSSCELGTEVFFNARHYWTNGHQGPTHPHSWRVQARFSGAIGKEGILVGFAEARQVVQSQVERFNGTILNNTPPFIDRQPTVENIAAVLYSEIKNALGALPIRLSSVCVWESPTNYVLYTEDGRREV